MRGKRVKLLRNGIINSLKHSGPVRSIKDVQLVSSSGLETLKNLTLIFEDSLGLSSWDLLRLVLTSGSKSRVLFDDWKISWFISKRKALGDSKYLNNLSCDEGEPPWVTFIYVHQGQWVALYWFQLLQSLIMSPFRAMIAFSSKKDRKWFSDDRCQILHKWKHLSLYEM